ncbi:MAG: MarR family winged helix-turn-helix transcriptional regulator [Phenylobacterium sp.]
MALRRFGAFSEAAAQDAGVTAQQHQALLAIRAHGGPEPMSVGELAECLLIKNHSAVELVARLVARGLVSRRPSEADRRRVELWLTSEAEATLEEITRKNLRELSSTAPVFRDLLRTLQRIGRLAGNDSR